MEFYNDYVFDKNFINQSEISNIVTWVDSIKHSGSDANHHLKELNKKLNGNSFIFDISNNELTNYVTNFQSIYDVSYDIPPDFIMEIINRVGNKLNFPKNNIYLQVVDMSSGGKIEPHYDVSKNGYINYKCNISVLSEDYDFFIDKNVIKVKQSDMYCFEASLYKHWTDEFKNRRVFLSIGFLLKYEELKRQYNDPRVRLSRRVEKYFQK
jgi:hypothetical protein